jgi:alpha-L-rhamnosidase
MKKNRNNGNAGNRVAGGIDGENWKAQWISQPGLDISVPNRWVCFRKTLSPSARPDLVLARIAVDSKYWLWLNGKLVVHEGQLKRGPTPIDTYYDTVDLTPEWQEGTNTICLLVWFFGKEGLCHKSSGVSGLAFEALLGDERVVSDKSWRVAVHPGFGPSDPPHPNLRLPESNIHFDARLDLRDWTQPEFDDSRWDFASELGCPPAAPWNKLVARPVPLWRFSEPQPYVNAAELPSEADGPRAWIGAPSRMERAILPYNQAVCPYLKIDAPAGLPITIYTDNYRGGDAYNIRVEYITREGVQEFESPAYLTGHEVIYDLPAGVRVLALKYRATRFDTDVVGYFRSSDPALDSLWQKAANTMLINMRDGIQDPDRERAQWWGDAVILIGMILRSCDRRAWTVIWKAIRNLVDWQKPDGVLYSPVPAGNWFLELPDQMLSAIGKYGIWYYYRHTGDRETLRYSYPASKKYLKLWQFEKNGLVKRRPGGWDWGDWGENKDMPVLINALMYMALEAAYLTALELGENGDAALWKGKMNGLQAGFDAKFWNGKEYRSPDHVGPADDRGNALAVVAGLAGEARFAALAKVFATQRHASPYMEKYVLEALFLMGRPADALQRMKERYHRMIESPLTTLWEAWSIGDREAALGGGGSYNHGWAGGPLTLLAEHIAGIKAVEPDFRRFELRPVLGLLDEFDCGVPTEHGVLSIRHEAAASGGRVIVSVPHGCSGLLFLPGRPAIEVGSGCRSFTLSGETKGTRGAKNRPASSVRAKAAARPRAGRALEAAK